MGYRNFHWDREIKSIRDGENASDRLQTAFVTPTQRTATQYGKQYVERKGRVPNNGDIGIQPDAGMEARTRFNAGRGNTTRQSPGIHLTQRSGQHQKDSKYLQKNPVLQVQPARPLQRVMPLKRWHTRKIEVQRKQPVQNCAGNKSRLAWDWSHCRLRFRTRRCILFLCFYRMLRGQRAYLICLSSFKGHDPL